MVSRLVVFVQLVSQLVLRMFAMLWAAQFFRGGGIVELVAGEVHLFRGANVSDQATASGKRS